MTRDSDKPFFGTRIGKLVARDCTFGVVNMGGHVHIDHADMERVGTAVYHMGPRTIDLSDINVGGQKVPPELLDRFLEELSARNGDLQKAEDTNSAAEASGLSKWLKDKGLDMAQVALAIAALIQG